MDKEEIFIAQDENGVEREGFLINKLEIEGQEYVVYALSMNNDEDSIYVSKIIKNGDNEDIVSITDEEERIKVYSIVNDMINNL